jgi:hypothetical protein
LNRKEDDLKLIEGKKFLINRTKERTSKLSQEYIKVFMKLIQKEDMVEMKRHIKLSENKYRSIISKFYSLLRNQFHNNI